MKKHLIFLGCMVLLPGCGRVVDWVNDSVNQGCDLKDYRVIPCKFLRSTTVYNQIETVCTFDALWLSDPVRTAYAQLLACKYCKDHEHEQAFLRRQLEENKHYITFYVLSLYGKPLDGEDVNWGLSLQVGDTCYAPLSISSVDLPPEYKYFFGKRLSKFKVPYKVTFSACDIESRPILTDNTQCFKLVFRSSQKEAHLYWDILQLSSNYDLGYGVCDSILTVT